MKNKKLVPIYIMLVLYIIINFLVSFTSFSSLFLNRLNPIILAIICIVTYQLDSSRNRNRNKIPKLQNFIIYMLLYVVIFYLFGLVFGFYKNIYSLSFRGILSNFFSFYLIVFFQEYIRYKLLINSKTNNNKFLITLLFIIININLYYLIKLDNSLDIITYLFGDFVPIVIMNITCTYLSSNISLIPSFIYMGIIYGINFFSPIIPDLNIFVYCLMLLILYMFITTSVDGLIILDNRKYNKRDVKKNKSPFMYILLFITFFFLLFVFGFFKYKPIVIVSNSMEPIFSKGDIIIIEKKNTKDFNNLKINDIIYYRYDNKYITHRIHDIKGNSNSYRYITKGDNNDNVDEWEITDKDVYGKYIFRIKYLGWPSVYFSELFN